FRHLFDLHDADAARAVDANAGVVAVVGNLDAALDRGLQDRLALLDGHRLAVNRQRHSVHKSSIIPRADGQTFTGAATRGWGLGLGAKGWLLPPPLAAADGRSQLVQCVASSTSLA